MGRLTACCALLPFACSIAFQAQGTGNATPAETTSANEAAAGSAVHSTDATTLETIVVTAPPQEPLDLDRFKNPVAVEPSAFAETWHETPSLEQIGLNGGVVPILVGMAARQVQKGARKIPGWKPPEQPANARPPPLNDNQAARAARLYDGDGP